MVIESNPETQSYDTCKEAWTNGKAIFVDGKYALIPGGITNEDYWKLCINLLIELNKQMEAIHPHKDIDGEKDPDAFFAEIKKQEEDLKEWRKSPFDPETIANAKKKYLTFDEEIFDASEETENIASER